MYVYRCTYTDATKEQNKPKENEQKIIFFAF